MFSSFFYLLRARGLDVSLNEWMTLMEALEKGLHDNSFTGFYYLARSIVVKSEVEYDKFDGAFLEFFKDMPLTQEIPDELMDWLTNPKEQRTGELDMARAMENAWLTNDQIEKMFAERLKEQKEEHNLGSKWVGTGGVSVFGNSGYSPKGIRVGGESRFRTAMRVAGERNFRDFRDDKVVDLRRYQMAFRSLRQFSARIDAPADELDLDKTIDDTCENAGNLKIAYRKPRKNTVKLLLLIDSGGSMDFYSNMCTTLFQAVSKSNHFKDLKVYYFHNYFKPRMYTTPQVRGGDSIATEWLLNNLSSDYKVIILGDALMDPYELMEDSYNYVLKERNPSGMEYFKMFKKKFPHIVWLNPAERQGWFRSGYWGRTYEIIANEFDMYTLTVENLEKALKKLMVSK